MVRHDGISVLISMHSENNVYSFSSILKKEEQIIEYCKTKGITNDFDRACAIFKVLKENEVFPCHLYNVVDELI